MSATLTFARSSQRSRRFHVDHTLVIAVSGLLLFGLIMVASASITIASSHGDAFFFLKKQALGVSLGVVAACIMCSFPTSLWQRMAVPLMLLALALLVLVLIPGIGHSVNGSRRWLPLGMSFQPSELARVLLLVYVASYIVRKQDEVKESVQGFVKPMGVLCVAAVLLLLEPDFGATTVLLATGMGTLFLAGVKLRHFIVLATAGAGGLALIAIASPYRLKRLLGFTNPWDDPFNSGFQLTQSLIAIGRGEWLGVGLGSSVQKLFYLPEAHTDFVFAVLAEEMGLIGIVALLALIVFTFFRIIKIAKAAAAAGLSFQAYVAASFAIWLAMQSFVNIGVNMGMLPTKGLTLPFISYGPSCMLVTMGWLGLILRIHHETALSGKTAVIKESRQNRNESRRDIRTEPKL
jgi:cell division protein FtsW